jgi:hypothetical protein
VPFELPDADAAVPLKAPSLSIQLDAPMGERIVL